MTTLAEITVILRRPPKAALEGSPMREIASFEARCARTSG